MSRTILLLRPTSTCERIPGSSLKHTEFLDLSTSAPTEVIALENTLNGAIFPQAEIIAISDYAHSKGIKMHLDGARIWHVAAETETSVKELCDPFDSISLCFSKGLGEVWSMIVVSHLTHCLKVHLLDLVWPVPKSLLPGPVGSGNSSEGGCVRQGS